MPTLFQHKKNVFGLDISTHSIKVFQLQKNKNVFKVLAYTDYPLKQGIIVNDAVMDEKLLAENIKAAVAKMGYGKVNTQWVIASIPESKAFVRVIQVPKIIEAQAEAEVNIESEQYIPIPLDQAYLDWQILGPAAEEKMDVLVAAAPKDYIDVFVRVIKAAGLRPVAIEVGSAAVARALVPAASKTQDLLIVDTGAYRTSLIVVSKGFLQFTSSVPIAGDAFNQSIARALGINKQEAEKAKVQFGLSADSPNPAIRTALLPVVDNLVEEIKNILKFHQAHSSTPITQIYLSGGGVRFPDFQKYLQNKLAGFEVQVILGNPWINVLDAATIAAAKLSGGDYLGYSAAIGLALRGAEFEV